MGNERGFDGPGLETMCGCRGRTMVVFLDGLRERYARFAQGVVRKEWSGVEGYLVKELGFSAIELEAMRRNLME